MPDKPPQTELTTTVDSYDLAILSALEENAGMSTIELSSIVHLSRTAVVRRINNLRNRGLIGYSTVEIDWKKLGFSVSAYVRVAAPSKTSFELLDKLLERPEVLTVSVILGSGLMMMEVIAVDSTHLHQFLTWLQDLADSETNIVLKRHKSRIRVRDRLRMLDRILSEPDERLI